MVNEAMLTGESVPQIKESLALVDQEQMGVFNPGGSLCLVVSAPIVVESG